MRRILALISLLAVMAVPALAAAQEPTAQASASRSSTAVNLNTATAQQLEALPGIGARMAQRIVDYRQKNGPFKKVEDLMNVQGIGEKNFLKLKPLLTIAPAKSEKASSQER